MKEFVEATHEADLCLTEPSRRAIGGQICKRKHINILRSATNAKDLPQTFTNQEVSLILYPALSLLLNGAWIL